MPFHRLTDVERRAICRERVDSLEHWLRRLIHDELSRAYGGDYIRAVGADGQNVLNNRIQQEMERNQMREPDRYPRLIDAALLDTEIDIICNPKLFGAHFRNALVEAFPEGVEEARTFLRRLLPSRNALSHANPILVRQCEQVVCYSNDVI